MLLALCCSSYARKVTGSVTCGTEKLEGVIVTDGENFTLTKKNGKFSFEINDDADFVHIVTPSGYVADWSTGVPAFYIPAQDCDKFHFNLQKLAAGPGYHLLAITDTQTNTDAHMDEFAGKPMDDIINTVNGFTSPAVGINLGDITWDNVDLLDRYRTEILRTGIPFYPVIGNHDHMAADGTDKAASADYRRLLGPESYAFFLGKELVIVLDNVIYGTDYTNTVSGYTPEVILWVKELEKLVPSETAVYVAQHAPFAGGRKLRNANALLDILRGRKVVFLSGHTHENYNHNIEKNITEHNVAAICGAWWDTIHCADGTPRGYKVFTKEGKSLTWYYKPIDFPKSRIAFAYGLGQTKKHPNSIVVNVWDWDPQWKVEWYEDGEYKGKMDPIYEIAPDYVKGLTEAYERYGEEIPGWKQPALSGHHFAATPDRYAKQVTVSVTGRFGQTWVETFNLAGYEEIEMECTSLEDAKAAIDAGANMIKMTMYPAKDGKIMAGSPDGLTLEETLDAVEDYIADQGCSPIRYHLVMIPQKQYLKYIDACMLELWPRFLEDRLLITCPEGLMLNRLKELYPELHFAE